MPATSKRSAEPRGSRWYRRAWIAALASALGASAGLVVAAPQAAPRTVPIPAIDDALDVDATTRDGVLVLAPRGTTPRAGLVFYPGARILKESYAPTLAPIADALDLLVLVPGMPFNLATLDEDAMVRVVADHPELDTWFVGGHSMGGIATFNHLADEPAVVGDLGIRGVVAWASFVPPDVDLHDLAAPVLHVVGALDTVIPVARTRASLARLPAAAAELVVIDGMAHGQFARYDPQAAQPGGRTDDETLTDLVAATVAFLRPLVPA